MAEDYDQLFQVVNETNNKTVDFYNEISYDVAIEFSQFVICLLGTMVDLLIIYIILRYKNMQKPVNIYILNWLICDALFILIDPAEYRLFRITYRLGVVEEIVCIMFTSVTIIRTLEVLFMLALMFYWFFDKTKITLFERHCYKIVLAVWIFALLELMIISVPCLVKDIFNFAGELFLISIIFIFVTCFIIIHCMRRCVNPFSSTSSLPVALISSFMIFWVTMVVIAFIFHLNYNKYSMLVYHISQIIVYSYPVVIFTLFYKIDPKFSICVRILFRCNSVEDDNTSFERTGNEDSGTCRNCPQQ